MEGVVATQDLVPDLQPASPPAATVLPAEPQQLADMSATPSHTPQPSTSSRALVYEEVTAVINSFRKFQRWSAGYSRRVP
jgi:hypothetical protein